ncbi:MAG: YaaR family protein [Lachnospiraceae bacterium]|jgi:uncharacterized protein YaaR (DUF327 family)|nr:YaaR family protein [Lachnospiraceae bacterium]MEE3461586.1 YaaR family protein [Lachnospiraceae bacterium]
MNIKVSNTQNVAPTSLPNGPAEAPDGNAFRFALLSSIEENELKAALSNMVKDITQQGDKLARRMDLEDMKKYRSMIKDFLNEVVNRSHEFTRENFLDRKGRHRVYGMIKQVNDNLDELMQEVLKEEKDHIKILSKIGEINGLLLDILT